MPNKTKQPQTQSGKTNKKSAPLSEKPSKFRGLKIKKRTPEKTNNNTVSDNRLEMLITTVDRSKAEYYLDLLQSFEVNMQFVALGHGTADAKMLAMFGLTASDKAIIFSIIQGDKIPAALAALEEKFRTIRNGKGIAYTVPLSGVIGKLIFGFLSNNQMAVQEDKK